MPNPRYVARVQTKNLRAELWINDIPAMMLFPGEADHPVALPLNEFLVSGRNVLGVMLHAGPLAGRSDRPWADHALASSYAGPATLSLRLARHADAGDENPPAILTVDWQGAAAPLPAMLQKEFDVPSAGPWAWEKATRFTALDDALRRQALDYLSHLHGLLASHRYAEFVSEGALKLDEMTTIAYGVAADPMRQSMLQVLAQHAVEPWRLYSLDPAAIDFRLVAGGRLIQCLRTDRHHALEYTRSDLKDTFFLPAMIGVTGSQWRVLR